MTSDEDSTNYEEYLVKQLQDTDYLIAFIQSAITDDDVDVEYLQMVLGDILRAVKAGLK